MPPYLGAMVTIMYTGHSSRQWDGDSLRVDATAGRVATKLVYYVLCGLKVKATYYPRLLYSRRRG